jgi:hypothetical protein
MQTQTAILQKSVGHGSRPFRVSMSLKEHCQDPTWELLEMQHSKLHPDPLNQNLSLKKNPCDSHAGSI